MIDAHLARSLERAEAGAWADFYRSAGESLASKLGVRVIEVSTGIVTIASSFDILAFNRALGIGLDGELEEDGLDAILEIFHGTGLTRAFLQVPPGLLSPKVEALIQSRGLHLHNHWIKMWRGLDSLPDVRTDLEIVEIGREMSQEFGSVVAESFGWPAGVSAMVAAAVGRANWRHYAALDGGRIVATAASFRSEDSSWLDFAATLPEARGRGAQSALLARRIRDAKKDGCRRALVETAEPRPDSPAQSHRNVARMGFEIAYRRPNFLWTRG